MKILIDCSNLQAGGGIQVALSFMNDLITMRIHEEFAILMSPQIAEALKMLILPDNFQTIKIPQKFYKNFLIRRREVKRLEDKIKPNIIFCVFGPSYHKSNFPKVVGFAIGQMLYRSSPYFDQLDFVSRFKLKTLLRVKKFFFINNSTALIFETEDAKSIFESNISKKIPCYVVNNTLNSIFQRKDDWKEYEGQFTGFNLLCLTANYPHKNLKIIPGIIDLLLVSKKIDNFKFNISVEKHELNFDSKYDEYINYLGKINLDEIPDLYSKMDVLLMPTLLEIFSTSYLEAMYMKKPIIASDMSFARDICGDAAIYCSPVDSAEYARAIINLFNDEALRKDLQNKGEINLKRFGTSIERTESYLKILKRHSNYGN